MSYLEIPIASARKRSDKVQSLQKIKFSISQDRSNPASWYRAPVTLFLINPQGTFDTVVFTHTVLSAAVIAAGFNVADIINEAIASNADVELMEEVFLQLLA